MSAILSRTVTAAGHVDRLKAHLRMFNVDISFRGSMMNDSFARSSLHLAAADQAVPTQETEAFQRNIEQQMQRVGFSHNLSIISQTWVLS